MSILPRNLASNPTSRVSPSISTFHTLPISKSPNASHISTSNRLSDSSKSLTLICRRCKDSVSINRFQSHRWEVRVSESYGFGDENEGRKGINFDYFLSLSEITVLVSSLVVSTGCLVNWAFFKHKNMGLTALGNRVLLWLLTVSVVLGAAIRRRQWRRVCGVPVNSSEAAGNRNVVERIEHLEDNVRSATTIIRVLSRKLEKLGVRFRVTRKTLKDPIEETAALTRKNSEVTHALEAQEDRLEKELAEVQNVLLAMQEQQVKQLELILAIAKNGKLFETRRGSDT